jgi:outer membrane protein assembly factor BamB
VLRSRTQYVLLASQEAIPTPQSVQPLPITNNVQQSRMHGRVYAFDRSTGRKQWLVPAVVAHHALPPDQPVESPLVLFVGMRQANNKMSTAVLALDRRTGEAIYQQDLANAIAVTCDIIAEPTKSSVTLALIGQANRTLTFQFTSQPRPPTPPAQLGQVAGPGRQPLVGAVDLDVGEAIRALNRGLSPKVLIPVLRNENAPAAQGR